MPEVRPTSGELGLEALLKGNDASAVMDAILGLTPSGAVIARAPDGKILCCSDHAAGLLGRSRSEVEGRLVAEFEEIIKPRDASGRRLPASELPIARALRGETVNAFEFSVEAADGRRIALIANAVPIRIRRRVIAAISSVTEFDFVKESKLYESAQQRLRGAEFIGEHQSLAAVVAASMQAVIAKGNDAVITLDASDRVVLFTPAAEKLFEVSAAEMQGERPLRLVPERDRKAHDSLLRDFRSDVGEAIRHIRFTGLRANGEEFPIEAWIARVGVRDETFVTAVVQDISERKLVEDARMKTLVAREVEHRAKNALGAVQALVKVTSADSPDELKRALHGRISAYARSFSLLMKGDWRGVDLGELVESELGASAAPAQMRMNGPKVRIAAQGVKVLSLVLHELTTNAMKYGALSQEGGVVDVSWKIVPGPMLELTWRETGGPTIAGPPAREGFGSVLLREVLVKQVNGALTLDWRQEGLTAVLTVPPPVFDSERRSGVRAVAH
jgi:PAS domain S-box-containing protein